MYTTKSGASYQLRVLMYINIHSSLKSAINVALLVGGNVNVDGAIYMWDRKYV
jgi:hypothetical protein